jgi:Rrf2 family protein
MLSQTNEYALRAVVSLARQAPGSLTTDELAELTDVPRGYLAKVLQQLRRAGIVVSRRGLRGGFVLVGQVDELTALDVVDAIDPLPRVTSCPLGRRGHGTDLCPLHRTLQHAGQEVERTLRATTIAALIHDPEPSPLCAVPDHSGR